MSARQVVAYSAQRLTRARSVSDCRETKERCRLHEVRMRAALADPLARQKIPGFRATRCPSVIVAPPTDPL